MGGVFTHAAKVSQCKQLACCGRVVGMGRRYLSVAVRQRVAAAWAKRQGQYWEGARARPGCQAGKIRFVACLGGAWREVGWWRARPTGQSRGREVGSGCDGRSSLAWSVGNSAGRKIDLYLERPKLGSFATLIDEQWGSAGSACGSSVASGRMVVCIGNSENREPLRTVIVNSGNTPNTPCSLRPSNEKGTDR